MAFYGDEKHDNGNEVKLCSYDVSVQQYGYRTAIIKVFAENPDQAIEKVQKDIDDRIIESDTLNWSEYESETGIETTGDVD